MNFRRPSSSLSHWRCVAALVAFGGVAPAFLPVTAPVQAAPKLEIWPGRRVLLVLPVSVSSNWNQDPALGAAIIPLTQPELQRALQQTQKFSIIVPYRFDPVLQRALVEKRVPDEEVRNLTEQPNLANAQALFGKLAFDQPAMIADVKLEELRSGGTAAAPTVQLVVSGSLYQQGNPSAGKTIQVTSNPVGGGKPEDRILRAARQAFAEIAAEFIAPPPSFSLPAMVVPTPAPVPTRTTPAPVAPIPNVVTVPPGTARVTPPNSLSSTPSGEFIPVLPAAQPPLGITVPSDPVGSR